MDLSSSSACKQDEDEEMEEEEDVMGECLLDKLPDELLTTVFSYLVEGDLGRCAPVSRRFNKIANDQGIW